MPGRRLGACICAAAVLLAACSGSGDTAGSTAVLGTATERAPAPPTPRPTPSPEPSPTASEPAPATATPTTATPTATPTRPATPTPTAEPTTAGPGGDGDAPGEAGSPASPSPTRSPAPEVLEAGAGWSVNTLLPDEDGEGWTEVGGPPPIGEDGESVERLLARLVHEGVSGDPAGILGRCDAWLQASEGRPLRVQGVVLVELLLHDEVVADASYPMDVEVAAGERLALPSWQRGTRLHAAEGAAVSCIASLIAISG